jgi:hypothetical protein
MIAAEVTIPVKLWTNQWEIEQWLYQHVGNLAPHRDTVDDRQYPWCVTESYQQLTYHFGRASDATAFALRWA